MSCVLKILKRSFYENDLNTCSVFLPKSQSSMDMISGNVCRKVLLQECITYTSNFVNVIVGLLIGIKTSL